MYIDLLYYLNQLQQIQGDERPSPQKNMEVQLSDAIQHYRRGLQ